jgi:glycosyltransferase involved in cell wall biosynthesis
LWVLSHLTHPQIAIYVNALPFPQVESPMRITFVLPFADLSGGIRVLAIYADQLKKRGHEVLVVSTKDQPPTIRQRLKQILKGQGLFQPQSRRASHFDTIDVPHKVVDSPVTEADVPDADVVIASWWETAEWMVNWSPAKGAKAYFIQHHEVFEYLPVDRVKATYRLPFHKIVVSKWLADLMQSEYDDDQTSLVLNTVNTQQFHAPLRGKQAEPTVGLVYSEVPWKGSKISLEAIAQVAQKIPNLKVVAFGEANPPDTLPPDATYVRFPAQAEIKDIYARCDVWICGSFSEGFGLPVVEAMACRCPVVSTEVGGPIDLIKPGVNGDLVPIGDAQKLAEGIERVLSLSDSQWREMSEAAYQTVVQYSWDDAATLFEAALEQAIDRNLPSPSQNITPTSESSPGLPIFVL